MTDGPGRYVESALEYAQQVVDGDIPACIEVIAACQRQLDDLERDWEFYFDCERAHHVCEFIESLRHIKGEWAKQRRTIDLEPWQCFLLTTAFGWMRDDGTRRFRTVYIEVPRKNAKSTLSAGVGLYLVAHDGEEGAEVYSAATTREQAKIVFETARQQALRSSELAAAGVDVKTHNIADLNSASFFRALHAEGSTMDGLNIHGVINDELHAWKRRDVYAVIETATGSRIQPMVWNITTAGYNTDGICFELRDYLKKVLDDVIDDDSFFGVIWTVDGERKGDDGAVIPADDYFDPLTWQKANPNYNVSVYPFDMERLARQAAEMPSKLNDFLTKRLNVWCNAASAWMDMRKFNACAQHEYTIDDFEGETCYGAIDAASKRDLIARARLFERDGEVYAFVDFYLPEVAARESPNASVYDGWARGGYITLTEGDIADIQRVQDETIAGEEQWPYSEFAFDPHNMTQFANNLAEDGITTVEVRQTPLQFDEPMRELEALIYAAKFKHDGNPVLAWNMSNVVMRGDKTRMHQMYYPRKETNTGKSTAWLLSSWR